MDHNQGNSLSDYLSTVGHLEQATGQLAQHQTQHSFIGRAFSTILAADHHLQDLAQRIEQFTTTISEQLSTLQGQVTTSREASNYLNHAFQVLRRTEGVLRQFDNVEPVEEAPLNHLVNKIQFVQKRILESFDTIEHDKQSVSARLVNQFSTLLENYTGISADSRSKLILPNPFQLSLIQKKTSVEIMREFRSDFPSGVFDFAQATTLIDALLVNNAHLENQIKLYQRLCPEIASSLQPVTALIGQIRPYEASKLRNAITEMLTLTCIRPNLEDQYLCSISPVRLLHILRQLPRDPSLQEVIMESPLGSALSGKATIFQKLHYLSHLNFSLPHIRQLRNDMLVSILLQSQNLDKFLFSASTDTNQNFRETCIGVSHNQLIQSRCGSIAELLYVARESIRICKMKLKKCSEADLAKVAYYAPLGGAPTRQRHIEVTLEQVENTLSSLTKTTLELISTKVISFPETQELTRIWNGAMQLLETVMEPMRIVVPSTLIMPSYYNVSAVISAVATSTTQISPGQPSYSARRAHDLDGTAISKISCELFSCAENGPLGGDVEVQQDIGASLTDGKITIEAIWDEIFVVGGGRMGIPGIPNDESCGHSISVFAVLRYGEPYFLQRDPMNRQQYLTLAEMQTYLQKRKQVFILIQPFSATPSAQPAH